MFRHALNIFHQAERASLPDAIRLYEYAGSEMAAAVLANPNHRQVSLASYYVALAAERSGHFGAAAQEYLRITRDHNDLRDAQGHDLEDEDRSERIDILEVSTLPAAVNLERTTDFRAALERWRALLTDPRFVDAADHAEHIADAQAAVALIEVHSRPIAPSRRTSPLDGWMGGVASSFAAVAPEPARRGARRVISPSPASARASPAQPRSVPAARRSPPGTRPPR